MGKFNFTPRFKLPLAAMLLCGALSASSEAARPAGEPQLERPTLHSLGVFWVIRDDPNRTASVHLEYRKAGAPAWRPGAPLFRVERGAHLREKLGSRIEVPADGRLFAGSALLLDSATVYEVRLTLVDSKSGKPEKRGAAGTSRVLKAQTRAEPRVPAGARKRHVVPGSGGGRGTEADPYRGLAAAHSASVPGDLFLLHKGTYAGPWVVHRSGTPEKPIVWAAAGDGPAVIDGQGSAHAIEASGTHDVWFEGLTAQNAHHGVTFHDSARIVVRRCHIRGVEYGMNAARDTRGLAQDHFVADNLIEGPSTWPRSKGIENARGIQITGEGHVVCYNQIRGFADAIDTMSSSRCAAIDFHNNELSELTDDGIELDYSERNTRCFFNRLTNVFQGISMQPVHGGPVYVFRNAMYNVAAEPFKLHNSPSGCLIFHNTCVKQGPPVVLMTPEPVRNSWTRNNLFVGTEANYAFESTAKMVDCDFDHDGFGGGPFNLFLKWNGVRYATVEEARRKSPVLKHAVLVDAATAFASGARPPADVAQQVQPSSIDLRLAPRSGAVDAGQALAGLSDGYHGKAPDLGAYELGDPLPHYGPRDAGTR
jgi:Right handed beta helix region